MTLLPKRFLRLIARHPDQPYPASYGAELDFQCFRLLPFVAPVTAILWLPFLYIDSELHPEATALPWLRSGLTMVSVGVLAWFLAWRRRADGRFLLGFIAGYIAFSTPAIAVLSGLDPSYLSGFPIVLLGLLIAPFTFWVTALLMVGSFAVLLTGTFIAPINSGQSYIHNIYTVESALVLGLLFAYYAHHTRYSAWRTARRLLEQRQAVTFEKEKAELLLETIHQDLESARKIQAAFLPPRSGRAGSWNWAVEYLPHSEVGGDLYDVHLFADGVLRVMIADTTGHGVEAALITCALKGEYDALKTKGSPPNDLLAELNSLFIHKYAAPGTFCSMVIADLDPRVGELRFASAGHATQIASVGGQALQLQAQGTLIGVAPDSPFGMSRYAIRGFNQLLLFTDGLYEQEMSPGELLGEQAFAQMLTREMGPTAEKTVENCMTAWQNKRGDVPIADDVTLIAVDGREAGAEIAEAIRSISHRL